MSSLWVPTVLSFPEPWSLTPNASYREVGDQCWCVMEVTAKHTGTCLQASMSLTSLPFSPFSSLCHSYLPSLPSSLSPSPFSLFLSLSWNRNERMHTFLSLNPTISSGVCVYDKSGKWICPHSSLLLFISVCTSVFPSLVSVYVHMNVYNYITIITFFTWYLSMSRLPKLFHFILSLQHHRFWYFGTQYIW